MPHGSKPALLPIRTLDALLPRRVRHWSTGDRFRARSAALILLIGAIAIVLHVLQLHWEKAEGVLLSSGYVYLVLIALFLVALKLVPRPQLIGSAYITMLSLITFWFTGLHARSVFAESFYWLPNLVLALYLVSGPRLASYMAGSIIAIAMLLALYLTSFGLRHPFDVTFEQFTVRIASTLLLCNASFLLLVVAFLALTRANRRAWKQEKEWQLQAARMREMSELAASAALLMEQPLHNLQAQHAALVAGPPDADKDGRILQEIIMDLQQVTRISESFSLLARPRQDEEAERMDAGIWLQHLTHIVLRRVAEKSWNLQIRYEPANLMIQGPLGRLSMLIVLCLQDTFMNPAPEPGSPLLLVLKGHRDHVTLRMEYKLPQQLLKTEDPINESLIEELRNSMAAVIRRTQSGDKVTIVIHGPWHDHPEQGGLIHKS